MNIFKENILYYFIDINTLKLVDIFVEDFVVVENLKITGKCITL